MTGTSEQQAPRLSLRLSARQPLTDAITQFTFVDPHNVDLPTFSPGAHITVQTPAGAMRRYSLISDPAQSDQYTIAVKRESQGRGGSSSLHDHLHLEDTVIVEPPANEFELVDAPAYLFIAGGIGITPILSMVRSLECNGISDYQLIYCTRDAEQTAFRDELQAPDRLGKITVHHDQGNTERAFDFWPLLETPDASHIYCCGPGPLMQEVRDMTGHWPISAIHFESFSPVEVIRADDAAFTVRLGDQGECVQIRADRTILETLRERGMSLRSSCESGSCGTCKTAYLSGEVDHRDLCLTEAEQETHLMICVSRAAHGELVLAL